MKIPEIKKLIETYDIEELLRAEKFILEDLSPEIEIYGTDEGEKLTHVMAAIWCKKLMQNKNINLKDAIREYTIKVRNSIN